MRQARPHLGEPVVDLGGNRGVDRAAHQPVALQTPHRQGEHALRDSADGALKLTETQPGGGGAVDGAALRYQPAAGERAEDRDGAAAQVPADGACRQPECAGGPGHGCGAG